ncbi:MAG: hypothetical protein V4596_10625 [Bdellovibrionota bacterium]
MKKIIFIAICLSTSFAFANRANEGGGGGHPCKEDFMNTLAWISSAPSHNTTPTDLRILLEAFNVAEPSRNPDFVIVVKEKPIEKCPNTDNPIACSHPKKNRLELYCDPNKARGWTSLDQEGKIKYAIHELLWWSPTYDDTNFYYSRGLAKRILGIAQGSESAEYAICQENQNFLSQSMSQFHELVAQQKFEDPEINSVISQINKHADSCIQTCYKDIRELCQETKRAINFK